MKASKSKPGPGGSGAETAAMPRGAAAIDLIGSLWPSSTFLAGNGTSSALRSLTEMQRRKLMLDNLIAIAASELDGEWARTLCRTVAAFAAADRELASIVTGLIREGRKGKPKGNAPWPRWRYWFLLEHYYGHRSMGDTSKDAADKMARLLSCSADDIMKKRLPRANALAKSLIEEFAGGAGQERRRQALEEAFATHRKRLSGG